MWDRRDLVAQGLDRGSHRAGVLSSWNLLLSETVVVATESARASLEFRSSLCSNRPQRDMRKTIETGPLSLRHLIAIRRSPHFIDAMDPYKPIAAGTSSFPRHPFSVFVDEAPPPFRCTCWLTTRGID